MNHTEDALSAALGYLNRALPLADRVTLSNDMLERVARHALMVRKATPWGESVPVDVFAPFVLPQGEQRGPLLLPRAHLGGAQGPRQGAGYEAGGAGDQPLVL